MLNYKITSSDCLLDYSARVVVWTNGQNITAYYLENKCKPANKIYS